MKQCTTLEASRVFSFKPDGAKGRAINVKPGQRFWVTNSEVNQSQSGVIMIDREGRGSISQGYAFDLDTLVTFFTEVAS